jgi:hypothetical protein
MQKPECTSLKTAHGGLGENGSLLYFSVLIWLREQTQNRDVSMFWSKRNIDKATKVPLERHRALLSSACPW